MTKEEKYRIAFYCTFEIGRIHEGEKCGDCPLKDKKCNAIIYCENVVIRTMIKYPEILYCVDDHMLNGFNLGYYEYLIFEMLRAGYLEEKEEYVYTT